MKKIAEVLMLIGVLIFVSTVYFTPSLGLVCFGGQALVFCGLLITAYVQIVERRRTSVADMLLLVAGLLVFSLGWDLNLARSTLPFVGIVLVIAGLLMMRWKKNREPNATHQ